jgi:hypothetical protein
VVQTTAKRLLCCGFRRTVRAMGQVYQCWRRICREINVAHAESEAETIQRIDFGSSRMVTQRKTRQSGKEMAF